MSDLSDEQLEALRDGRGPDPDLHITEVCAELIALRAERAKLEAALTGADAMLQLCAPWVVAFDKKVSPERDITLRSLRELRARIAPLIAPVDREDKR